MERVVECAYSFRCVGNELRVLFRAFRRDFVPFVRSELDAVKPSSIPSNGTTILNDFRNKSSMAVEDPYMIADPEFALSLVGHLH